MTAKTLLIASDHAGFALKERLKARFPQITWQDLGPTDDGRVDYPDFADLVASKVSNGEGAGVLICGSGQGMAMRANRYPRVRAALAWNEESARLAREHNDANILCLGARLIDEASAEKILNTFTSTEFAGGRHSGRIEKLGRKTEGGC